MRKLLVLIAVVSVALAAFGTANAAAARPNTQIHGGPTGTTSSRTARFHMVALKNGVLCRGCKIQCKLNAGSWRVCVKGNQGYVTFRNLARRKHTLRARAVDAQGRKDLSPAVRTWRVA
jgi:hypothetical protein